MSNSEGLIFHLNANHFNKIQEQQALERFRNWNVLKWRGVFSARFQHRIRAPFNDGRDYRQCVVAQEGKKYSRIWKFFWRKAEFPEIHARPVTSDLYRYQWEHRIHRSETVIFSEQTYTCCSSTHDSYDPRAMANWLLKHLKKAIFWIFEELSERFRPLLILHPKNQKNGTVTGD